MSTYEVIVTPDAERDLHEISSYITNVIGERGTALKQVRAIRQAMSSLNVMPSRIRPIEEQAVVDLRHTQAFRRQLLYLLPRS